jgi:hypothetical protein
MKEINCHTFYFIYKMNWSHLHYIQVIWPYSGPYRPTEKNLMEFIHFFEEHHVDMTNVKVNNIVSFPLDLRNFCMGHNSSLKIQFVE